MRIKNIHDEIAVDDYMRAGHGQTPALLELSTLLAAARHAFASLSASVGRALAAVCRLRRGHLGGLAPATPSVVARG